MKSVNFISTYAVALCLVASCTTARATTTGEGPDNVASGTANTIVVSGIHANTSSREAQEDAPNIIQSITQGEARRLPDLNAGEAIARLPGASLSVDTGQGRWVNIRGLDADLTSTTYGGVHLPPTNPVTPQMAGAPLPSTRSPRA